MKILQTDCIPYLVSKTEFRSLTIKQQKKTKAADMKFYYLRWITGYTFLD